MADLWPKFDTDQSEENRTKAILQEQARALGNKTNNKVKATFSKISYSHNLFGTLNMLANVNKDVEQDGTLGGKEDINELFNKTKYKFEVFNETYRFRVFIVEYSILFPITLIVDDGIKEELPKDTDYSITSNAELEDLLRSIFYSKKLTIIISQMMKDK